MSFLVQLLEVLWGKKTSTSPPLLPLHMSTDDTSLLMDDEYEYEYEEEEEPSDEYEPAPFKTKEDFVDYVLDRSDQGTNLYFDMFNVEDADVFGKPVQVWWMSINHPYARMFQHNNDQRFEETGGIKYMDFDAHRNIVAYQDCVIQRAVDAVRIMIEERTSNGCGVAAAVASSLETPKDKEEEIIVPQKKLE
jgi:hypothetical protein